MSIIKRTMASIGRRHVCFRSNADDATSSLNPLVAVQLVLVVGDLDIPSRAVSVHEKFKRILAPGKIAHVLCVGNCARDQLQFLRSIAPRVHIVQGNDGEGAPLLAGRCWPAEQCLVLL